MSVVVFLTAIVMTSSPAVYSGVVTTEDRYPEVSDSPPPPPPPPSSSSPSLPALKSLSANEHRDFTHSCDQVVAEDSSTVTGRIDVYPVLTTGLPPPPTRDEYAQNQMVFYTYADDEGNRSRPQGMAVAEGQRWQHSANRFENAQQVLPKRNGYNHGYRRRLKKQRVPVVVEMDLDDVRDAAAATAGADDYEDDDDEDAEVDKRPGGGAEHGHVPANGRRPGAADANDRLLAAKIASAKLKTVGALKLLALLAAKLKLLVLLKLHLFAKLYVLANAAKLLSLRLPGQWPAILAVLVNLLAVLSASNSSVNGVNGVNGISGVTVGVPGTTVIGSSRNRRARENGGTVGGGFHCVERAACRAAGRLGSATTAFANRILSYLVDYITNKKLKSFTSTLKEISDYRSKNVFNTPSTKEWLKWCKEHYPCEKKKEFSD